MEDMFLKVSILLTIVLLFGTDVACHMSVLLNVHSAIAFHMLQYLEHIVSHSFTFLLTRFMLSVPVHSTMVYPYIAIHIPMPTFC